VATQVYPSDLKEAEWALLAPLIPPAKPGGRPRSVDPRRIVNGIFYVLRTGCAWRYLPREYGPWSTTSWYFRPWRLDGTWARIHAHLRELARLHAGRNPTPSAALSESQSVKTLMGGMRGFDGHQQVAGRPAPHPGRHRGLRAERRGPSRQSSRPCWRAPRPRRGG
jgi:putative transposase